MIVYNDVLLITGTMFGGKSKALIKMIETVKKDKSKAYIAFKPSNDSRDGLYITSRTSDKKIKASPLYKDSSRFTQDFRIAIKAFMLINMGKDRYVFVDEAQFLSRQEIISIVDICQAYRCKIIISGILTDFKLEYFESIKWAYDNFTSHFYHGRCNRCCEDNAVHNILYENGKIVTEGSSFHPGDQEYKVYCHGCYNLIKK